MPTNPSALGYIGKSYDSLINDIINTTNSTSMQAANTQLGVSQAVSGGYNDLLSQLYAQYGPQLAATGIDIGKIIQQGQANNNASVANSEGGQASLNAAIAADKTANPEFYSSRELEANRLSDLMKSIDLSGQLSGSEQRAIGQSIAQQGNQTGTVNTPSATQTTANAMQYGDATYKRQETAKSDLASAIGQATSFLPASTSKVDSWGAATGGPTTSTGTGESSLGLFGGTASGANPYASTINSLMGSVLGAYSGTQNTMLNNGQSADNTLTSSGMGMV